jgi:hypothetical protein
VGHYLFNFAKKGAAKGKTLREQAGELLQLKMWGIGAKAPNRLSLAAGDRVLIYVGAPEYEFIGHAELGSGTHEWTTEEAARYLGSFEGGVLFSQAEVWSHPVPMKSVLLQLALKETNPGARFFSGVVRVTKEDYETVVAVGTGKVPPSKPREAGLPPPEPPPSTSPRAISPADVTMPGGDGRSPINLNVLFKTVEKLTPAAQLRGSLSDTTRALSSSTSTWKRSAIRTSATSNAARPSTRATSLTTFCASTVKPRSQSRQKSSAHRLVLRRPLRSLPTARTSACAGER